MINEIKERCGIAASIQLYDNEIQSLINSAKQDLKLSGVSNDMLASDDEGIQAVVLNAIAAYVRLHLGNDRTDMNKLNNMYNALRQRLYFMSLPEVEEDV